MDCDVCVYQHRRNDTGEIFYIGKGSELRPFDQKSRNPHWQNIVKNYGYTVEIVCDDLDDVHASSLEAMLIQFHGRRDTGTGPLVNMTDGGDGVRGRVMPPKSSETRAKLSAALKGKPKTPEHIANMAASRRGWIPSDEHRAKMSAALRGRKQSKAHVEKRAAAIRGENSPMWGRKLPQETRDKISDAQAGRCLTPEWSANIASGKRGRARGHGASSFCGVSVNGNKWLARISDETGNRVYLGLHTTEEDAARAYDSAALDLYGPGARLNFPAKAAA